MRKRSQDAIAEFRPFFDKHPAYGNGPSLEETMRRVPLWWAARRRFDRTLQFREYFGDYQRQLFNVDGMGLPHQAVLEGIDMLGEEVVPVLRKEFAAVRPAHIPAAPTHETLKVAAERVR
jgi:hypothetical protein